MKKIFITGGKGFIGRNLVEGLVKDFNVYSPSQRELDLLDTEKVTKYLDNNKFDIVIHCATLDASRNSTKNLNLVLKNNLRMFFNLTSNNNLFKRMFYFGSGAEYDKNNYIPKMKENYFGKYIPNNDYGFSKYIMAKYSSFLDNVIDLRLFGCFGKYEDYTIRFISNAICKAIYDLPITIKKNVFFDYLYIEDLVRIMKLLINKQKLTHKHYNVCTGKTLDLLSLADMIINLTKKKLKVKIVNSGLNPEYSGNNDRLIKELGKFNFTPFNNALSELYQWYIINKNLINNQLLLIDK